MNIFIRELKANRKVLIIWSVCMFLLVASGMGKYTGYSGSSQNLDVFNEMPFTLKALLGIGSFNVTVMSGYFALLFLYIELTTAIHAVLLGSGIIAKEERDKTTEFLMTRPVSRGAIITAKFGAALFNVVILNLVTLVSSLMMVSVYNKGKDISNEILLFMLSMFAVQLIFLFFGSLLASCMRKPKLAGSLASGILIGSFMVAKITDLTDKVNALNILSPFKYFNYADIVNGNGISLPVTLLSLALAAAFAAASYLLYRRRDLSI